MPVTDEQVATLRAHLAGDVEEYQRRWGRLDRNAARAGYMALLAAAFFEAVDRRFAQSGTAADVIEFVGALRARLDEDADEVDPVVAERLIRDALGDGSIDDLDEDTIISTKVLLLTALISDEKLGDAELDEFMATARSLGDRLMS
ncbi:hypothetical protein [Actinoallomurus sp. CA-142502]|uniref:hypothetical protein n=1 Tax=Actinoallomurus sp. CA-142502 TaxID=3239885 RepID=UPI003D935B93